MPASAPRTRCGRARGTMFTADLAGLTVLPGAGLLPGRPGLRSRSRGRLQGRKRQPRLRRQGSTARSRSTSRPLRRSHPTPAHRKPPGANTFSFASRRGRGRPTHRLGRRHPGPDGRRGRTHPCREGFSVRFRDYRAWGDNLFYNEETEQIRAEGSVVLMRGNEVLRGSRLELELKTETASVFDVEGNLGADYFFTGSAVHKLSDERFTILDAQFTACEATDWQGSGLELPRQEGRRERERLREDPRRVLRVKNATGRLPALHAVAGEELPGQRLPHAEARLLHPPGTLSRHRLLLGNQPELRRHIQRRPLRRRPGQRRECVFHAALLGAGNRVSGTTPARQPRASSTAT